MKITVQKTVTEEKEIDLSTPVYRKLGTIIYKHYLVGQEPRTIAVHPTGSIIKCPLDLNSYELGEGWEVATYADYQDAIEKFFN